MGTVLEFPRQRRRHKRAPVSQPVALVHENASVATAMACNISPGGMQILCDRYTTDSLHRSGCDDETARDVPRIDAHFKLPLNSGLAKLDVECLLSYVCETDDEVFALGLEFVDMTEGSSQHLGQFLDEATLLAN